MSLDRLSHWHASRWGHVALVSTKRRARHGLARWIRGRNLSHRAVGLRLRGSGGYRRPRAAVEKAEDFRLQVLLIAGADAGAGTRRQAEVASLRCRVGRMRHGKDRGCGWHVGVCGCNGGWNVDPSCEGDGLN